MLKINEEMLQLTKDMVAVSSVNTTKGEKDIGLFIEDYLRAIPYFKEHPNQVIVQTLKNDKLERRNVFALLLGQKDKNSKTIIFHGHTDTVGVEDYGALAGYAFDCDGLAEQLKEIELPEEVKKDLESGEYLFGRGACDMKSGDAVFMILLKELSEHVSDLSGNILLSLNPVEENLHTGIIEGIEVIEKLKKEYDLDYVLAINNDYTCPMYPGDKHHYIYTGVGGKLLPCFYIQGRETHVGQCFEGYDPTTVMAELIKEMNLNPEYSDVYEGEYALPPTLLKSKDLKGWYNVQTAKEALVYFNYFVLNSDVRDITKKLVSAGDKAVRRASADLNIKYKAFCEKSGKDFQQIKNNWSVMSYEDLYQMVKNHDEYIDKILAEETVKLQEAGVDKREIPVSYIRILLARANIYHPVVVLYYATPYCPHNTLEKNDEAVEKLEKILKVVEEENNIEYRMDGFFPSLSDSSYLSLDDSMESIETLKHNFPQMQQLYPLPLEQIKKLNIKAVNFGVYGKDAHKSTERLQIPYSFGVLPELIMKTTEVFLNVC
ncbi:M20/M25/M40 family metallo-hydrolase [Butyrivibrio fibrisolvens]|uniref:M20/M25/M40 family metallo-hydrolase n=1 Tax=Pseudobutyrivibrio ruminis TaxID=46206 RepID=UPI0004850F3C|nr:M20/M25/M40 family metallo-hydrolase [Pseudobutyrivibrio ruminis]MDC7280142.1 M20/M25/M40 family metallo-hydrolase [Butyrivibrio fibrisolvens]